LVAGRVAIPVGTPMLDKPGLVPGLFLPPSQRVTPLVANGSAPHHASRAEGSMSMGAGVFLGLCVIAVVWVYSGTKDRWRWGRIARIGGGILASVVAIFVLTGLGAWGYSSWKEGRNEVPKSVKGVALGDSRTDLQFKFGERVKPVHDKNGAPEPDELLISGDSMFVGVTLEGDRTVGAWSACRDGFDSYDINQIRCGETGDAITKRFGTEMERWCKPSDLQIRAYVVQRYQVAYSLREDKVQGFLIGRDADFSIRKEWRPCA
jgi:hypothetical protein